MKQCGNSWISKSNLLEEVKQDEVNFEHLCDCIPYKTNSFKYCYLYSERKKIPKKVTPYLKFVKTKKLQQLDQLRYRVLDFCQYTLKPTLLRMHTRKYKVKELFSYYVHSSSCV